MRLYGTIDEWIAHRPEAFLRNDAILSEKHLAICGFAKSHTQLEGTIPVGRPYGTEPILYIGSKRICPYLEKNKFWYTARLDSYEFIGGQFVYLSDQQASDDRWYEWSEDAWRGWLNEGNENDAFTKGLW